MQDEGFKLLSSAISRPAYPTTHFTEFTTPSASRLYCNLRRLYLSATGLRPAGAKHLGLCISSLGHLTHLELSDNPGLGCQGVLALRSYLQSYTRKKLVYLGLARCGIACQGGIALAEVLADTPRALRRLDLSGNGIAEAGLMAIAKSLEFCTQLVQLQGLEENRPGLIGEADQGRKSGPSSPTLNGFIGAKIAVSFVFSG